MYKNLFFFSAILFIPRSGWVVYTEARMCSIHIHHTQPHNSVPTFRCCLV